MDRNLWYRFTAKVQRTPRIHKHDSVPLIPRTGCWHVVGSPSTRVLWLGAELGTSSRTALLCVAMRCYALLRGVLLLAEDIRLDVNPIREESLKKPEYLVLNPNGDVPALEHGGEVYWECGAVMQFLIRHSSTPSMFASKSKPGTCDRSPADLFPESWSAKDYAIHDRFVFWSLTTLDARLKPQSGLGMCSKCRGAFPLLTRSSAVHLSSETKTWFNSVVVPVVRAQLQDRPFIHGNDFTATDIYLGYSLIMAEHVFKLLGPYEDLRRYIRKLAARPAFRDASKGLHLEL